MMSTLHFDRRDQIMSVVDATSTSERDAIIAISQKKQIKARNILEKLNKLRVLYELNEQLINESILWEKLKRVTNMIEKLTRQRMKEQLNRLKKLTNKLKKNSQTKQKQINNWIKVTNEKIEQSTQRNLNIDVNATSSIRHICEKFEIKIFIKEKKKIKKVMTTTTKNIINRAREINSSKTLSKRKNIKIMKRRSRFIIFKINTKNNKKILKSNDFWVKKISFDASLRDVNYEMIVHEIKIKRMLKNMKKNDAKTFTKINKNIHSKMKINKMKWFIKNNSQKKYASLIARVINVEMTNKLIKNEMCHESNIKTTQYYDSKCKVHQCLKCQTYDHKTYECNNDQKCVYCAQTHRSKHCSHK